MKIQIIPLVKKVVLFAGVLGVANLAWSQLPQPGSGKIDAGALMAINLHADAGAIPVPVDNFVCDELGNVIRRGFKSEGQPTD